MRHAKTLLLSLAALALGATCSLADQFIVDPAEKELLIEAVVQKDCSQPAVCDWGKRGQAWFGSKGGKMEPFFIFVTEVNRTDIDKGLKEVGARSVRQITKAETDKHKGLKTTTAKEDYLNGDPILAVVRFEKDGQKYELAMEDLIEEKFVFEGAEIVKPYTPHFVYHGTAEAINFPSGCIICPSDCNGGIITDNALPLLTTTSQFKVDWTKMPAPGSKVEIVLKTVRGGPRAK